MLQGESRSKKEVTQKWFLSFFFFLVLSFLILTTYQWRPDFSENLIKIRLWQYILAIFSGGALGVAGFALQKITRNNLADVSILGIGSINVICIIVAILIFHNGTVQSTVALRPWLPVISTLSSAFGCWVIYKLSGNSGNKFIFVGLSMQFIFESLSVVLSNSKVEGSRTRISSEIKSYSYGSFPDLNTLSKFPSWIFITLLSCFIISAITYLIHTWRRDLDLINIGEEYAISKGVELKKIKGLIFFSIAVLAGLEASMVGTIALLGVVAPHVSRMFFRNASNVFSTFLIGAMLVMISTFLASNLDMNIPIGLLSVAIICPIFLWSILR